MYKKIELLANVGIIVIALILGAVLVKRFLLSETPSAPPPAARISAGTKVQVAGVDWSKGNQNLVLVLSDTCHFCTESAGFYQRLAEQKAKQAGARLIAVLPQDVGRGQAYMNKLGVAVDEVQQSPLNALGVSGTPTLLLVDNQGIVKESWLGKLPPDKETEVLSRLQAQ